MSNLANHKKKLNLLQVFRGLASVLVVLAHCNLIFQQNFGQKFLFKIFDFGGSGVDFFFVLSGFIILYVHQRDIGNKEKLKSFFIKRFTRIYPIYWVFLILKLLASFLFDYDPDSSQRSFVEVFKALILFPQDRSILATSFLGVSWTLSFEIFFYIIFGLLIGLAPKISYPIIATWLLGIFANFIGLINIPKESFLLQFIFSQYNLEFCLGCLAAYLFSKYKVNWGMMLISVGAFLYTLSAINYYYRVIELSPVITFGIPSMLLVLGSTFLEKVRNIEIPSLFIYLGDASYSIYLAHGFAINNITKVVLKIYPGITQNTFMLNILGIFASLLAIVFGCVVYSSIEKQLLSILKPKLVST